jgi:threonine dehydrogenase-like Zn-dependent dehydrogenase
MYRPLSGDSVGFKIPSTVVLHSERRVEEAPRCSQSKSNIMQVVRQIDGGRRGTHSDFTQVVTGCDAVFDTVGGDVAQRSFAVLKPGGRAAFIASGP